MLLADGSGARRSRPPAANPGDRNAGGHSQNGRTVPRRVRPAETQSSRGGGRGPHRGISASPRSTGEGETPAAFRGEMPGGGHRLACLSGGRCPDRGGGDDLVPGEEVPRGIEPLRSRPGREVALPIPALPGMGTSGRRGIPRNGSFPPLGGRSAGFGLDRTNVRTNEREPLIHGGECGDRDAPLSRRTEAHRGCSLDLPRADPPGPEGPGPVPGTVGASGRLRRGRRNHRIGRGTGTSRGDRPLRPTGRDCGGVFRTRTGPAGPGRDDRLPDAGGSRKPPGGRRCGDGTVDPGRPPSPARLRPRSDRSRRDPPAEGAGVGPFARGWAVPRASPAPPTPYRGAIRGRRGERAYPGNRAMCVPARMAQSRMGAMTIRSIRPFTMGFEFSSKRAMARKVAIPDARV